MSKIFYQITKNEKYTIKNEKLEKNINRRNEK